jgi:hypothetical protein
MGGMRNRKKEFRGERRSPTAEYIILPSKKERHIAVDMPLI